MNIVPQEIITTEVANRIDIRVSRLELFVQVDLFVTIKSSSGKMISSKSISLKGDDYKAWSNDDSYLYTYVAKKLGYTIAPKL
jgi:hypothetical protein